MITADQVYEALPPQYRQGDEVLGVILGAALVRAEAAREALEGLPDLFDPDELPDEFLDWAVWLNGWPVLPNFSAAVRRAVLEKIPLWREDFGQAGVFEDIIRTYFANAFTVLVLACYPTHGGIRIGQGRTGRGRVWDEISTDSLVVRVSAAYSLGLDDRLKSLLEVILPPWMEYRVDYGGV